MDLQAIQAALQQADVDGWLFFDFRNSDPLGASILGLPRETHRTRRWGYYLPASGEPVRIVHAIEAGALNALPGEKRTYFRWQELHQFLREALSGAKRIAMQYSPENAIPYIARVDAGTVELIRSFGVEVVTSADLVQQFEARIDEPQWQTHVAAADKLATIMKESFEAIAVRLRDHIATTEYEIQQYIMSRFQDEGLCTDHPPIVAVNAHSADPHYAPSEAESSPIRTGDFVLIDMWAKFDRPGSIFADITWTGYVGAQIPPRYEEIFQIVRRARDAALAAVEQAQRAGEPIRGCDVDDVCRKVIADAGYGDRFIHRTGHSIHEVGHGNGANLDNLETRDERRLIPRTCFSIEPGIYLPGEFGIRSEINVFLPNEKSVIVSGAPAQTELIRIV